MPTEFAMRLTARITSLVLAVGTAALLSACGGGAEVDISGGGGGGGGGGTPYPQPNPNPDPPTLSCSQAGLAASAASKWGTVCMLTSSGEIVVELYDSYAPQTVANFYNYVAAGFYTNTLIHRVDRDFVVQGGGYTSGMVARAPLYGPIKLESNNGLSNLRGTLAMARRSAPDSATSQFFFNVQDNASLDYQSASNPGYAVFGRIISGLATLDAINVVPTYTYSPTDIEPRTEVLVYWAQRLK
ncbi:peptidyl-prolyl cis-trans isomerase [Pelomonas aquatica]|uniref:Peptidyl-prolyl cis-trans isomerase n=2 Tax=Pelomonas aquatica TaxID=431058 RepID=A0A9X4LI63_9BURK|nr:peptidyl-prolyl cis-trans isomerase [Pelomonas aquatica]